MSKQESRVYSVIAWLAIVVNLGRLSNSVEPIKLMVDKQNVTLSSASNRRLDNNWLCNDLAQGQNKQMLLGNNLRFYSWW